MTDKAGKQVFVVGMNGSGTTMLLDCLGRHPDLFAFPVETRLIPWLLTNRERYGDLSDDQNFERLWKEVLAIPAFRKVNEDEPLPLPSDWKDCKRTIPAVIDHILSSMARDAGKRIWCEKTPQHAQHIALLAEAFPNAVFIHMIRDGRDCAASFQRRWGRTPQLSIYRWKKVVSTADDQGRALGGGRYLEIKYEEITAEPEPWLRVACNFLGLPFDREVLTSSAPYLKKSAAGTQTLQPNSGKWRSRFSGLTIRSLESIAGSTLAEFGYPTGRPDADRDPSPVRIKSWMVRDTLRQFTREVRLKATGQLTRSWSTILRRPLSAIRQGRANHY